MLNALCIEVEGIETMLLNQLFDHVEVLDDYGILTVVPVFLDVGLQVFVEV